MTRDDKHAALAGVAVALAVAIFICVISLATTAIAKPPFEVPDHKVLFLANGGTFEQQRTFIPDVGDTVAFHNWPKEEWVVVARHWEERVDFGGGGVDGPTVIIELGVAP